MIKIPSIKALILTGGKSSRMGEDKGKLDYHGIPQAGYLYNLMEDTGRETFISCRADQLEEYKNFNCISDQYENTGPIAAILSAFSANAEVAWLVIACDMPWIDKDSVAFLLAKRNPSKIATAFFNQEADMPEPLFTIWEPSSFPVLQSNAAQGRYSPYRILTENEVEIIDDHEQRWLKNLNTPEERDEFNRQHFS